VTSVYHILEGFNQGQIDAQIAAERLSISRARLYQLRTSGSGTKPLSNCARLAAITIRYGPKRRMSF